MHYYDLLSQCETMIRQLDSERCWNLGPAGRATYVDAVLPFVLPGADANRIRTTLINYHHDHHLVIHLTDHNDALCSRNCSLWLDQVIGMLYQQQPCYDRTGPLVRQKLSRIVWQELVNTLPSFNYSSRFLTWCYRLVVRSVQQQPLS